MFAYTSLAAHDGATDTYNVAPIANALYAVSYLTQVAGTVQGTVAVGDPSTQLTSADPFTSAVSPASVDAASCALSGATGIQVGGTGTITITSKDQYGNVLSKGGSPFEVEIVSDERTGLSLSQPSDNRDGTYSISIGIAEGTDWRSPRRTSSSP
jgi:hypothetical protein